MKKTILLIVGVIVVAGVSGGGVYLWQSKKLGLEKKDLQKQIEELQQKAQVASDKSDTKSSTKTYTDGKYGYSFQYPSDLEISPIPYTLNVFAGLDGVSLNRVVGDVGHVGTIAIEENTDGKTLDQAVESIIKRYGPIGGTNSSSIKIDGVDAILYVAKDPSAEYNLVNTGLVAIKNNLIVYIMGGTKDSVILKNIADTFKFWKY